MEHIVNADDRHAVVVEDDEDIRELLTEVLGQAGFSTEAVASGRQGVDLVRRTNPDLVTLDLGLPDLDGVEVCRQLRAAGNTAYIIMLTARAEEIDRLIGLEIGADDYLTKPFSPRELRARAMAMLRRPRQLGGRTSDTATGAPLRFGELEVDVESRVATLAGKELELTRTEFELLATLIANPRRVWTRDLLLSKVWGTEWIGDTHVVEVHMGNLRRKLDDDSRGSRWIRTVRGVGYRMGAG
jgi:DNA-binding response OmpR family regulator